MVTKTKPSLMSLFLLGLLSVCFCYEHDDPPAQELHRCKLKSVEPLKPIRLQGQCQERCQRQYKERKESEQKGEKEQEANNNPYYFEAQRFELLFSSEDGHFAVLEKFSNRSELLRGVDNYRLAVLEANPNTFVLPQHFDAELVFIVLQGKGIITQVQQDRRDSSKLERGDVFRVPAGTTFYLINHDNNKKLRIAQLLQPINTAGIFELYVGVGGDNQESYYSVFSKEILEASFNTSGDKLAKVFEPQRKGVIRRASQEQIRALSQHASSEGPFNLLNQSPLLSNKFGKFFEVSQNDYEQLRGLNLSVAFVNISQGAMTLPYYVTKTTILMMVVEGSGGFEIANPLLASRSQQVGGTLAAGDVIAVPPGPPFVFFASDSENMELIGFEVNPENNQRNFVAGPTNIWNWVETEAKELSFNLPGKEIEKIFKNQEEFPFVAGPRAGRGIKIDLETALKID